MANILNLSAAAGANTSRLATMIAAASGRDQTGGQTAIPAPGVMGTGAAPIETGIAHCHLWSEDAATDFPNVATANAYVDARALAIPVHLRSRRIYFGIWWDDITDAACEGEVQFLREGNPALTLPFKLARSGNTLADSYGIALPPMDVWKLDAADDFVAPAAGDLAPDGLFLADTATAARYMTTLVPMRMRFAADQARIRFWSWSVTGTAASAFVHLGVISEA